MIRKSNYSFTNPVRTLVNAVQEGARIAGYTVKAIEATQVRLIGPNGNVVLHPTFAAAAASRATKAPSPR